MSITQIIHTDLFKSSVLSFLTNKELGNLQSTCKAAHLSPKDMQIVLREQIELQQGEISTKDLPEYYSLIKGSIQSFSPRESNHKRPRTDSYIETVARLEKIVCLANTLFFYEPFDSAQKLRALKQVMDGQIVNDPANDPSLIIFSSLCPESRKHLSLSVEMGGEEMCNHQLKYLVGMKVTSLDLSSMDYLTPRGLRYLKQLPLTSLFLGGNMEGDALEEIAQIRSLTELGLIREFEVGQETLYSISAEEMRPLSTLRNLRGLHFNYHEIEPGAWVHLRALPIYSLTVTAIDGQGLAAITTNLPHLTHLVIEDSPRLADQDLAHLSNLRLRALEMNSCPEITDEGLDHLAKIRTLRDFCFDEYSSYEDLKVTSEGLGKLVSQLPRLKSYNLPG